MSQRDTEWSLLPSSSQAEEAQHGVVEEDSGVEVCVENIAMVSCSRPGTKKAYRLGIKRGEDIPWGVGGADFGRMETDSCLRLQGL